MADQMEKSNHQQQRHQDENVDEPVQKRHKPNESEYPINAAETRKFTNIYYDCLERIFDFLDLKSLFMVAQTCKRLQIAAAVKFSDKFGKKRVRLYPHDPKPDVSAYEEGVEVRSMKLCLQFLRCFGAKISYLHVDYDWEYPKEDYLDQYIIQYCADTLTSIEFEHKWQFSNEVFQKPFKNVEKVGLKRCRLRDQLKNFINWFPKLRHLDMFKYSPDKTAPMNVSFPHLEHLELYIDEYDFRTADAANLLQANPQLQSIKLRLEFELTLTTVLNTIISNSLITKLEVVGNYFHSVVNVNTDELNRFVAEHPLVEELILEDHGMAAVDAINFIRQMKLLKQVEFELKDQPECDCITQELNNEGKSEVSSFEHQFYIKLNR